MRGLENWGLVGLGYVCNFLGMGRLNVMVSKF